MRETDAIVLLYVTAGSAGEAEALGRAVVEAGFAACANILPGMRSVYRWRGAVETAEEAVLIVKTTMARRDDAEAAILRHHSYATPCVLALHPTAGTPAYLDWLLAAGLGGAEEGAP